MIRIPLEKACNVRDLGGYVTKDGKMTAFGRFLRSDGITELTEADKCKLKEYGVKTVIDLRSREELDEKPNSLGQDEDVYYAHFGILDHIAQEMYPPHVLERDFLGEMYIIIMEHCQNPLASVFRLMASAEEGCILFHCTAGKDRTGIVAALLLDLAGVDYYDIVANYEVTYTYIRKNLENIVRVAPNVPGSIGLSKPQSIELFLGHLHGKYRNAEGYLNHIGISREEVDYIRNRLTAVGHHENAD